MHQLTSRMVTHITTHTVKASKQGRKRDRVELELVLELTRSRLLVCGFGASSYPSSRSFEIEFDEAAGLRVRVFTEFLWKS